MNEQESKLNFAPDQNLVKKRLARITELIGKTIKTEMETAELRDLLSEQKDYEKTIYKEEFKSDPLSEEEKNELRQLRKKQFSGDFLASEETNRIVELSKREKVIN